MPHIKSIYFLQCWDDTSISTSSFFIFTSQSSQAEVLGFFLNLMVLKVLDIISDYYSVMWPHETVHVDLVYNTSRDSDCVLLLKCLLLVCECMCEAEEWWSVRQVGEKLAFYSTAFEGLKYILCCTAALSLISTSGFMSPALAAWVMTEPLCVGDVFHFL